MKFGPAYVASTEVVDWQTDKAFFNDVTQILQEVIDYRETIVGATKRIKGVLEFVKQTMRPKLIDCIERHTHMKIKTMHISDVPNQFFAMNLEFRNMTRTFTILENMSGRSFLFGGETLSVKTVKDLKALAKSIDQEENTVSQAKLKASGVVLTLFFDPCSGFLAKEMMHVKLDYMTAEELAAIMMHEVGHMYSMLEHCADTYYRLTSFNSLMDHFNKTADLDERRKLYREVAFKYKDKDKLAHAIVTVSDKIEELQKDDHPSGVVTTTLIILLKTLILLLSCAAHTFVWPYMTIAYLLGTPGDVQGSVWFEALLDPALTSSEKNSDFPFTSRNAKWIERWADEYATRMGAGKALVTALNKFHSYTPHVFMTMFSGSDRIENNTIRNSSIMYYYYQFCSWYLSLINGDGTRADFGIYEDTTIDRYQRIRTYLVTGLKQSNLPAEEVNTLIKDYEDIGIAISKSNMNTNMYMSKLKMFVMHWIGAPSLIQSMLSGKFSIEYAQLLEDLERMSSSPLYYHAAKLDQLAREIPHDPKA
jgi:hypothetical protein